MVQCLLLTEQKGEVNGKPVMSIEGSKRFDVERSELDKLTYEGNINGMRRLLEQGQNPDDGGITNSTFTACACTSNLIIE